VDEEFDQCNHGTRIAGILAAPMDGVSIVGGAYRANLHAVKAGDSVWGLFPDFARNHLNGIRKVRGSGARIVVMAFGSPRGYEWFADGLRYEFYRSDIPDALFFAAVGTTICPSSLLDDYFPSGMDETLSVTGVGPDGITRSPACNARKVDISAVLERSETTGETTADVITIDGSSNATGILAAVAAQVWSKSPSFSRDEVWNRLRSTARFINGGEHWIVDGNKAAGGLMSLEIQVVKTTRRGRDARRLVASTSDADSIQYSWDTGETTEHITRTTSGVATVVVRDVIDGTILKASVTLDCQ